MLLMRKGQLIVDMDDDVSGQATSTNKYPMGATLHSVSMSTSVLVLHVEWIVGSANHCSNAGAFLSPATLHSTVQITVSLNSFCTQLMSLYWSQLWLS